MNLTKWEPFHELEELTERLNRIFPSPTLALRRGNGREAVTMADWMPSVDISEDAEHYAIHVELPGMKKADVKVRVQDGLLTIQGERKQATEEKGLKFHRVERLYGNFVRSFSVPVDADETKLAAEFRDGILHVTLPKAVGAKPRAIEVAIK